MAKTYTEELTLPEGVSIEQATAAIAEMEAYAPIEPKSELQKTLGGKQNRFSLVDEGDGIAKMVSQVEINKKSINKKLASIPLA